MAMSESYGPSFGIHHSHRASWNVDSVPCTLYVSMITTMRIAIAGTLLYKSFDPSVLL